MRSRFTTRRALSLAGCAVIGVGVAVAPAAYSLDPTKPEIGQHDLSKGTLDGSPLDHLPAHITTLPIDLPGQARPMRGDWSPDSGRLIFLDAEIGNVWEYTLATRELRRLTGDGHFLPAGVLRAHYLSNGDLLLCGLPKRSETDPDGDRSRGELYVLPRPLGHRPPAALHEGCWEGVAVSKQPGSTRIAWNRSQIDFSKVPGVFVQAANGQSQILTGRIAYDGKGRPSLVHKRVVVDRHDVGPDAIVEVQDFRASRAGANELVFSVYFHRGGEVMGVDLRTGRLRDYARSPWYEEAEGIDPAGRYTLVERDLAVVVFPGALDIWRLSLDGTGSYERLTYFDQYKDYGADNPVVAPDGRRFVFQVHSENSGAGSGEALLLFNLRKWDARPGRVSGPDPFRLPERPV